MNRIIHGCVLDVLPTLPEQSVQMCVTSPPYWGLRDYGTATWEGGDADCSHLGGPMRTKMGVNANTGTGTTGEVCESLGRQWLGIELNAEYIALARRRTAQVGLGL